MRAVRPSACHTMYATTAKQIQMALVGAYQNRSKHLYICKLIIYVCRPIFIQIMTGPRSANVYTHMHIDKATLPANFHPNRQPPWPSFI